MIDDVNNNTINDDDDVNSNDDDDGGDNDDYTDDDYYYGSLPAGTNTTELFEFQHMSHWPILRQWLCDMLP